MGPFYNCCLCSVSVGGGDLCEKCATLLIKAEIEKNTREIVFHQLTKAEIKKRTRENEIYQKKLKEFKTIDYQSEDCQQNAQRFSQELFKKKFKTLLSVGFTSKLKVWIMVLIFSLGFSIYSLVSI